MSENNRMTSVPDFLSELDAGVFENKLSAALNEVAFGTNKNGGTGEVHVIFKFTQSDEDRVKISHKLKMVTPTKRGKNRKRIQPKHRCGSVKAGNSLFCRKTRGSYLVSTAVLTGN